VVFLGGDHRLGGALMAKLTGKERVGTAFWCGCVLNMGANWWYQDYLGLERYIERVRQNWVAMHWSIGAAVAIAAFLIYHYQRDKIGGR
jgi:hypothetical protein